MRLLALCSWAALVAFASRANAQAPAQAPAQASASTAPEPRRLSLPEALALALQKVPALQTAAARTATARARIDAASVPQRPGLSVSAGPHAFASSGSFFVGGVTADAQAQTVLWGDVSADARWTVWDFGRTTHAADAARRGAEAAALDESARRAEVVERAALAYLAVHGDDGLLAEAEETVRRRDRQLATVTALVKSGARSDFDLQRARFARDAALADVTRAKAQRAVDGVALAVALGLDPTERLAVDEPRLAPGPAVSEGAAAAQATQRPELRGAEATLSQSLEALGAARAGRAPTLGIDGSASLRYTARPDVGTSAGSQLVLGRALLTVPLLDPAVSARIRTAEAEVQERKAAVDETRARLRSQGAEAAVQVAAAEAVLAQADNLAQEAQATLAHGEARYKEGFAGLLELLDAQGVDAAARLARVRARVQLAAAQVRLLVATGRAAELAGRAR